MKSRHIIHVKGFSLFELLIYMAILAGLMVVITNSMFSLSRGRGIVQAKSEVNATSRQITEILRQDIKAAASVSTPTPGNSSSTLILVGATGSTRYSMSNGVLNKFSPDGSTTTLNSSSTYVGVPAFTVLSNYNSRLQATTTAVQIVIPVSYNSSSTDWAYSNTLRTTATIR